MAVERGRCSLILFAALGWLVAETATFRPGYYQPPSDPEQARKEWLQALEIVRDFCECEGGECPIRFKHGIIVDSGGNTGGQLRATWLEKVTVVAFCTC